MPLNLVILPPTKGGRIPLDEIHPDVVQAVEESFEACKTNPGRLSTEDALFLPENKSLYDALAAGIDNPTRKEIAEAFLHQARSYAYQREPRVTVTGNPTSKGEARYRVELYVAPPADDTPTDAS